MYFYFILSIDLTETSFSRNTHFQTYWDPLGSIQHMFNTSNTYVHFRDTRERVTRVNQSLKWPFRNQLIEPKHIGISLMDFGE